MIDYSGIAVLIASIGAFVGVCVTGYVSIKGINGIKHEVKTMNESTIGQLAAREETRRAEDIPHDQRTAREQRHISSSPAADPAQGPLNG
jgi:hypothetical protein